MNASKQKPCRKLAAKPAVSPAQAARARQEARDKARNAAAAERMEKLRRAIAALHPGGRVADGQTCSSLLGKLRFIDAAGREFMETPVRVLAGRWSPAESAETAAGRAGALGAWREKAIAAAARAGVTSVVVAMLNAGVTADALTPSHETPLLLAAARGYSLTADALLAGGADPGLFCGPNGARLSSPLLAAAAGGHLEAARSLIAAGADPGAANALGQSPLALAEQGGFAEVADLISRSLGSGATASVSARAAARLFGAAA